MHHIILNNTVLYFVFITSVKNLRAQMLFKLHKRLLTTNEERKWSPATNHFIWKGNDIKTTKKLSPKPKIRKFVGVKFLEVIKSPSSHYFTLIISIQSLGIAICVLIFLTELKCTLFSKEKEKIVHTTALTVFGCGSWNEFRNRFEKIVYESIKYRNIILWLLYCWEQKLGKKCEEMP